MNGCLRCGHETTILPGRCVYACSDCVDDALSLAIAVGQQCPGLGPMIMGTQAQEAYSVVCARYLGTGRWSRSFLRWSSWANLGVLAGITRVDLTRAWRNLPRAAADDTAGPWPASPDLARAPRTAVVMAFLCWALMQTGAALLLAFGPGVFFLPFAGASFEGALPFTGYREFDMLSEITFPLACCLLAFGLLVNELARATQRGRFTSVDSLHRVPYFSCLAILVNVLYLSCLFIRYYGNSISNLVAMHLYVYMYGAAIVYLAVALPYAAVQCLCFAPAGLRPAGSLALPCLHLVGLAFLAEGNLVPELLALVSTSACLTIMWATRRAPQADRALAPRSSISLEAPRSPARALRPG
ncbi:unnamed protein product [Prorocentrum cordatum]|uniref:Uncharacterized protein n=1 Tax=Prorocentrum cordatum TaxID=2364126 RepID=A0ABN9XLV1_9DINO|nr:unnamed protein product [Polarella glacialis]